VVAQNKTQAWLDEIDLAWKQERIWARDEVRQRWHNTTLGQRCASGFAISHLQVEQERGAPGQRVATRFAVPASVDLDDVAIGPGDPVVVWRGGAHSPDNSDAIRGVMQRRDGQSIWIMLDRGVDEINSDYQVDMESPETSFDRGAAAIAAVRVAKSGTALARLREVLSGVTPGHIGPARSWDPIDTALDERQLQAVERALMASDVALIHGPPGTGKTRTIVEFIAQCIRLDMKVLCVAPSNTAVDNVGERLLAANIRIIRLGHPARVSQSLADATLDAQVDADGASELARSWRDRATALRKNAHGRTPEARERWAEARRLEKDAVEELQRAAIRMIERAHVVLATCVGAATSLLRGQIFDVVVIDEATQAADPVALIAMLCAGKVVLVGDPQQLGPVVKSPCSTALRTTVFDRAASQQPATMLVQQHRMNVQIMQFSSIQMYASELQAAPAVASHTLDNLGCRRDPSRDAPLWLIDTAGKDWTEQTRPESTSLFNEGNAQRAALEVRRLLARGLPGADIAVIAMYSAQVKRLRQLLRDERELGVEVSTVDGFQGREREAVIIDTVRSNDRNQIGFLADLRRANVAMTRARRFLLVIADSATLAENPYFAALIDYFDKHDAHGSAWSEDVVL
jgi:ATP-dependent RNA/DNA helicase IGHMBP2